MMWTYMGNGYAVSDSGEQRWFRSGNIVIWERVDGTVDVGEAFWMPPGSRFMFDD